MFHAVTTIALACVALGWLLRHRLGHHVACMGAACLMDYGTLIALELSRGPAIAKALSAPPPLLSFHVAVSVAALLCYPALIVLGIGSVTKKPHWLSVHRRTGRAFLLVRLANYVTSWMI